MSHLQNPVMEAEEGYILWLKKQSDLDPTLSQHYPLERPQLYDQVVRAAEGSKEVDVCLVNSLFYLIIIPD